MTDAIDLTTEQRNQLSDLLRRFIPGVAVWAYGSRVKWTARPNSDLDLVAFAPPAQRPQVSELKEALAESNLPFPVDLHVWDDVPERFREIIRKEYVVVQEAKQQPSKLGMAGEWCEVALEEIKAPSENALATGPFGSSIGSRFFTTSGIPVIRGSNLSEDIGTRLNDKGLVFLSPEKAGEFSRSKVRDGDLIFTCWGTVNQVGLIDRRAAHREYIISNKQMKLTPDPAKADSLFLYYLFSSPELQARIKNQSIGSSVPGFNLGQLRAMRIQLPELGEQRAIAHVLGTLDDKIELNLRMNETLETMARVLFKSWFIDFDPVRAKAEGRDPGLPKPLADLFPSRLVDSELGEIPEKWRVKKLSDLCSTQYGYTASALDEPVGPKLLRVTDINKRNWIEWADVPHCAIDPEERAPYALKPGDLVVARMADPGKSAIIEEEIDAVFASYLVRLKTVSLAHSYYIHGFLKSDLYAEYAEGAKGGSVQANMNAKVITGASLVVPPTTIMEQFLRAVLPLRQRLVTNVHESRTLAVLCDTLLPKLISGKLRIVPRNLARSNTSNL